MKYSTTLSTLITVALCSLPAVAAEQSGPLQYNLTPQPSFSFVQKGQEPGGEAQPLSQLSQPILAGYFDIEVTAKAGDLVTGRVNLTANHKATFTDPQLLPASYQIKLLTGSDIFSLNSFRDHKGRLLGELKLVKPQALTLNQAIPISLALVNADTVIAKVDSQVHVVETTLQQSFNQQAIDYVMHTSRLLKRYKLKSKAFKKTVKALNKHKGKNPAYADIYDPKYRQWLTEQKDNQSTEHKKKVQEHSKKLYRAAEDIAGLAWQYASNKAFAQGGERAKLRQLIQQAIIQYAKIFPSSQDIGNAFHLISYADATHQWRFTDPLVGAMLVILPDTLEEIKQGNALAKTAQQSLVDLLSLTSFAVPDSYRSTDSIRYFLKDEALLRQSNGSLADANRGHRMRTWIGQVAINNDYNRPLTELAYWYNEYQPWAKHNTAILPEWQPSGAFHDLKVWVDTNTQLAAHYVQSGILPDGSISHHTGVRQDMAHYAYGFEWMTHGAIGAANMLKDTAFAAEPHFYDSAVDFITYTYPRIMYKTALDFQTSGRSHKSPEIDSFASSLLIPAINKITSSMPAKMELTNAQPLQALLAQAQAGQVGYNGMTAFWVNDYLTHSKAGQDGFFTSIKMQSLRSKGAEGFKGSYGFHNGSGVSLFKVNGDEYANTRFIMDWHALPGVTEELRTDPLPLSSKEKAYNPEPFAGMVTDGEFGLASFHYDREDSYTSASGRKSWFLTPEYTYAMGNSIKRTKPGQGKAIITTVDQSLFAKDISLSVDGKIQTIAAGESVDMIIKPQSGFWLHHDNKGYFIFNQAEQGASLLLKTGNKVVPSDKKNAKNFADLAVFLLAINHGTNPQAGSYQYVVVNHISPAQMPVWAKRLTKLETVNQAGLQALTDQQQGLSQAVFHQAGQFKQQNGQSFDAAQPMIFQAVNKHHSWQISAADPLHNPTTKALAINTNLPLKNGQYPYLTQGMEKLYVDGQLANISDNNLVFNKPDTADMSAYNQRVELYTGMPMVITVTAKE